MNVLILGSGGREHALSWKIAQSPLCKSIYVAPGNPGTAEFAQNQNLDVNDFEAIAQFVVSKQIDLLIVGPEDPLVHGLVDFLKENPDTASLRTIGPTRAGAMLEGSKDFAKQFMKEEGIPTAAYLSVTQSNLNEGLAFLQQLNAPYVLKADGLAAGKGVLILDKLEEAEEALKEMLDGKFGAASKTVVVEEFLDGIECSVFVLTDGKSYLMLPEAKDYKRIGEGDTGLNTGGMGAISPVPFATPDFLKRVEKEIVAPTLKGLKSRRIDYRGFIFFGLMKVGEQPYVIEYNVRMGDPETEAVLPRIESDLLKHLLACSEQSLENESLRIDMRTCATLMIVSGGYPGSYEKGKGILLPFTPQYSVLFHAGTGVDAGKLVTKGGRVIAVSSLADDLPAALKASYRLAQEVQFEGKYFRNDIGQDLLHEDENRS